MTNPKPHILHARAFLLSPRQGLLVLLWVGGSTIPVSGARTSTPGMRSTPPTIEGRENESFPSGLVTHANCHQHLSAAHWICDYMRKHRKEYPLPEWNFRKDTLRSNKLHIEQHNEGTVGFSIGLNSLSDLSHEEFQRKHLTSGRTRPKAGLQQGLRQSPNIPRRWDWRHHGGALQGVVKQGACGSCFSIVAGSMLDFWGWKLHALPSSRPASFQPLMDCSMAMFPQESDGCLGSTMRWALQVAQRLAIPSLADAPYYGKDSPCHRTTHKLPYQTVVPKSLFETEIESDPNIESKLANYVFNYGVVGISFDASDRALQHYQSGVYSSLSCSKSEVNHAMAIVGYDEHYWIVKNSWGQGWGENGFFKVKRGHNVCGAMEVVSVLQSAVLQ